jgi:methylamine dehydrogenase light chain
MRKKFRPDRLGEDLTRRLAGYTSRRSLLNKLGLVLVAAPVFPLLPVSRANAAKADRSPEAVTHFARDAQATDDTKCNYWRYCAIDGFLCTCCGGGVHTCPAGSEPSPVSWVGTCVNPEDKRVYLIAYRDCCGKAQCGQCVCDNNDRATQVYQPQTDNNIIWCFGTSNAEYHCSTAALVGPAQ